MRRFLSFVLFFCCDRATTILKTQGQGMEMGGACGARSWLADVWVMHGMVMDELLHVFPGGGVGELLRVC